MWALPHGNNSRRPYSRCRTKCVWWFQRPAGPSRQDRGLTQFSQTGGISSSRLPFPLRAHDFEQDWEPYTLRMVSGVPGMQADFDRVFLMRSEEHTSEL